MSRIGKKPIEIPDKVKVELKEGVIHVQGPKGAGTPLTRRLPEEIELVITPKTVEVKRKNDGRSARSLHGIIRTLISNMVVGVSVGFERKLEINGLGLKAKVSGQTLELSLGFSHSVKVIIPKGVTAKVDSNTKVTLSGADKEALGQFAAEIRSLKPPEPYKGTGIRYAGEVIIRKVGKTAGAAA